ncbi:MAG: ABC transporter ATP-binding protein/permease [Myxacorys chilensis ATA2-1-KO14]|jgi:subfamily B ATP-binding cassette protein MsbA|nr:ABC transporter ATP-binding protein/permease [Myxacorys chilensis ATA2-1-KO14]
MRSKLPNVMRSVLKSTSVWRENRLILREFKHFPWVVTAAVTFALASAAFEGFGFGLLLAFLQSLVGGPSALPFQTGINWFDVQILGIDRSKTEQLYRISALILSATWIRAAFNYLTQIYTELSQQKLIDRLRKQTFERLQAVNLSYFGQTHSGELINTLTGEIGKIQIAFGLLAYIVTKGLTLLVYTFLLFAISWKLTIVSVVLFGLVIVGLTKLNRRVRESSFAVTAASGKFTTIALEFVNGIRTVQAFATQDYERKRFYQASSNVLNTGMNAARRWAIVRPMAEGLATTVLISMIILAITVFVANGTLQTASLLTFLFLLFRLVPALHEINGNRAQLSSYDGAFANISEVLREDNKPYFQDGDRAYTSLERAIDLVAVEFGYAPGQVVLKDVTLTIPKGKMTAIVGGSGAGKTTLVDLIPRFYDPTVGQVLFDGVDVRSFAIKSLRRKMAIVSQDTFVFNASVRYNIAYGLDDVTDEMVWKAAQQANALEFILDLPEQFETPLGDRGVRLSGGQRQRLAIARALLRDPEILILDEATSALDSVSERLIQESLEQLSEGRTVIAIAHRLSTIVRADKVVVLEQGQIAEQGTYQELLNLRGRLWNYHQMQHETRVKG